MKIPKVCTIDFETKRAQRRPEYPPVPVSMSIFKPGSKTPKAYAWGHPNKNNCTKREAQQALQDAWYDDRWELLFHFANFDVDCAVAHMDMGMPVWRRIHDTSYLLALHDPHATLKLKQFCESVLGLPAEERDEVIEWLKANFKDRLKGEKWAAYIAEAPGDIVMPYVNGDTLRTKAIFNFAYADIVSRGMLPAYDRERQLMPILLANEQEGVHVDLPLLRKDTKIYGASLESADSWLRKRLRAPSMNIDSNEEFANALDKCNLVNPGDWVYTKPTANFPNGQRSVSKENLTPAMIKDKRVALMYGFRNKMTTCLKTFMLPWLITAEKTGGTIHTEWSQTKNADSGRGAATFRLSSSPNFQNIPLDMEGKDGVSHAELMKVVASITGLPAMRTYLLPDPGGVWGKADYSQQELRLLDYFTYGSLGYKQNPKIDVHGMMAQAVIDEGLPLFLNRPLKDVRYDMKRGVVFPKIYGSGVAGICDTLGCSPIIAKKIIAIMMKVMPGYEQLERDVKAVAMRGEPIVTWDGREYFVEPARYVPDFGRVTDFYYKLINYLIQGSAAGMIKEAIIRYHNHPKRRSRFLLSVHDEIDISIPSPKLVKVELGILTECMESMEIDPPMIADPAYGPRWSELVEAH